METQQNFTGLHNAICFLISFILRIDNLPFFLFPYRDSSSLCLVKYICVIKHFWKLECLYKKNQQNNKVVLSPTSKQEISLSSFFVSRLLLLYTQSYYSRSDFFAGHTSIPVRIHCTNHKTNFFGVSKNWL